MKRNKLAALLGAGLLTFGITGVALADTLNGSFVDVKASDMLLGSAEDCANQFPNLGAGEVGFFFVLGGADQSDGSLHVVTHNPDGTYDLANSTDSQGGNLRWAVTVTGDGDTTLDAATNTDATSNASGDDHLVVSHVCFGAEVTSPPTTPPTTPPTEAPTPSQGFGGDTNAPSQPSTDSVVGTGNSGPSDTAWLLVVALGVILASVVVLTPARSKTRR